MAVYKVIQDVESEDKLLGPLSLKGFIYAAIAGILAFIEYTLLFSQLAPTVKGTIALVLALPMILFGVLASPLGHEQPTEVWLLSRIRFLVKPHGRIWDQEGSNDLVTITVPKKDEKELTDGLSQTEVKSRLKTLALTLDTRGWAVKNVDVNLNLPDSTVAGVITPDSDRLVKPGGLPRQMAVVDVHAADDILDEKNNPTAQKFENMMQKAEVQRRHGIMAALKDLVDDDRPAKKNQKKPEDENTKDLPGAQAALSRLKKSNAAELLAIRDQKQEEFARQLAKARYDFAKEHGGDKKTPVGAHKILKAKAAPALAPQPKPAAPIQTPVTAARQTVNMELAQSGSAFSVATLSQLANRQPRVEQNGPNEVTISLH